jgi:hypothetical protein
MFSLERDMREPVLTWARRRGYVCAVEVWLAYICDIVAVEYGPRLSRSQSPILKSAVAIELKLDDAAGVLAQAVCNRRYASLSYAAMPVDRITKMRPQTLCKFYDEGIGMLAVSPKRVCEVFPGQIGGEVSERLEKQLWRRTRAEYLASGKTEPFVCATTEY